MKHNLVITRKNHGLYDQNSIRAGKYAGLVALLEFRTEIVFDAWMIRPISDQELVSAFTYIFYKHPPVYPQKVI